MRRSSIELNSERKFRIMGVDKYGKATTLLIKETGNQALSYDKLLIEVEETKGEMEAE